MRRIYLVKIFSIFLAVTLFIPTKSLWAQKLELITSEGTAAILGGDKAIARDRAIADALRRAVEQAVGTMVEADTLVSNYQVLSDNIYSKSRGYIQSYALTKEIATEDVYKVIVEAVVSMDYLEEDFQGMAALLQRVHKPRLLIKILIDAPGWSKSSSDLNAAESTLIEVFDQQGFDLVGKDTLNTAMENTSTTTIGNDKEAAAWGLAQGAEIILAGKAVVKKVHLPMLGTMNSYQANISLSAIKTDTAEVMATGSDQDAAVHIDDSNGTQQAIQKAAKKLGEQMLVKLRNKLNQEVNEGTTVQIVITGLNDSQLVDFKNALGEQVRGVQPGSVHQRFFANGTAKLDVQVQGNAQFLADELTRKSFDKFKVSLTNFSTNKLELRFIPKGSVPER